MKRTSKPFCSPATLAAVFAALAVAPVAPAGPTRRNMRNHVTGTVEVQWRGKGGPSGMTAEPKLAFASVAGFPTDPARGEFVFSIFNPDQTAHREIVADLVRVETDPIARRSWLVGQVVSDIKLCYRDHTGGDHGDGGTGGNMPTDSGGGSSHDSGCEDGCDDSDHAAHDTTTSTPMAGSGGTDAGTHDDGGCSGSGTAGGGPHVSGGASRLGQMIIIKIRDEGTPARAGDHITWKWFAEPKEDWEWEWWFTFDLVTEGPHLCKKTILGGNLVIHTAD